MTRTANRLNDLWNRAIFWFHDASVRLGSPILVRLSVWACHRMLWTLPEEWRLVGGKPYREYILKHELETARHQIQYYANYAHELQWQIILQEEPRRRRKRRPSGEPEQEPQTLAPP